MATDKCIPFEGDPGASDTLAWGHNEPNNWNNGEDCSAIWWDVGASRWLANDVRCEWNPSHPLYAICNADCT